MCWNVEFLHNRSVSARSPAGYGGIALGHDSNSPDDKPHLAFCGEGLSIKSIRLTNNPFKISSLKAAVIKVIERIKPGSYVNPEKLQYLLTTAQCMKYLLHVANTTIDDR